MPVDNPLLPHEREARVEVLTRLTEAAALMRMARAAALRMGLHEISSYIKMDIIASETTLRLAHQILSPAVPAVAVDATKGASPSTASSGPSVAAPATNAATKATT